LSTSSLHEDLDEKLVEAAGRGDVEKVKELLEKGANPNAEAKGWGVLPPLHRAARGGNTEITKLLIEKGADINAKDKDGRTPLYYAAESGHIHVVELLIEKGADPNAKDDIGWTPLHCAAWEGHTDIAKLLIEKGADVNAKDSKGRIPLCLAAVKNCVDIAKLLIEKGADVNAKDKDGQTLLHCAARGGNTEITKLLIEKGADINAKDKDGRTPLHEAAAYGHADFIKLLIEKGVSLNIKDNKGLTPLHEAAHSGHIGAVKLLIEKGADPNAKDDDGWTPLHYAAKMVHTHIVELLIKMGADPNIRNKDGKTPADVAPKVSLNFLEKLRDYLNERLKDEALYFGFKPFRIVKYQTGDLEVHTESITAVRSVEFRADGTIAVESELVDKGGDYIGERLVKNYRRRFKEAEAKGKEEEDKVWKALDKKEKEIYRDYINRKNLEKHLKKNYREAFIRLLWFDEVAKRVSKEYGIDVKVEIDEIDYDSGLISEFDGSNMSEEEKFEEIKKRVEAITAAYKLAYSAYGTYGWISEENHKKYLEFRKALLEKLKSVKKI